MTILLRTSEIRRIETQAMADLPPGTLMARAAEAVAEACSAIARTLDGARTIVAWVGPGNNGGDALLAVLLLRARGYRVRAIALDAHRVPTGDAGAVWQRAQRENLPIETGAAWDEVLADRVPPIVLDGLFGIGLQRPLDEDCAVICARLAELDCPVIAVDVPSGIDADTGRRIGSHAVRAHHTVTMIAGKPGLHTGAAVDHVGQVSVATLGIAPALIEATESATEAGTESAPFPAGGTGRRGQPVDAEAVAYRDDNASETGGTGNTRALGVPRGTARVRGVGFDFAEARKNALPARRSDSSKGSFGSVLCYGGAPGMRGAALLAARGAQAGGAGRIYVATPAGELFDPAQAQWMSAPSDTAFDAFDAVAIGCGLGTSDAARTALRRASEQARALVIDADALNLLAGDASLRQFFTDGNPADQKPATPNLAGRNVAGRHLTDRNVAGQNVVNREPKNREPENREPENRNSGEPEPKDQNCGTGPARALCIATPHPLEAARLLGTEVADVQSDRIGAACALAAKLRCVVLLKGAGSVVATPAGAWSIIVAGSPALASAGTGDVLAGLCASLLARGLDAGRAACLGAWLHGTAGSLWAAAHGTGDGLPAARLDDWVRAAMAQLRTGDPVDTGQPAAKLPLEGHAIR